jgi:hypothetical protein
MVITLEGYSVCLAAKMYMGCRVDVGVSVTVAVDVAVGEGVLVGRGVWVDSGVELGVLASNVGETTAAIEADSPGGWLQPAVDRPRINPNNNQISPPFILNFLTIYKIILFSLAPKGIVTNFGSFSDEFLMRIASDFHKKIAQPMLSDFYMAERVGFEPTFPCGKHALQACALGRTTRPLRVKLFEQR